MSNGAPIVVRVAVKPVATLRKPLDSVDLATGEVRRAHIERSDVAILPRAAVVGEAMVALVLADALLATLGWRHHGRRAGGGPPAAARSRGPRAARGVEVRRRPRPRSPAGRRRRRGDPVPGADA